MARFGCAGTSRGGTKRELRDSLTELLIDWGEREKGLTIRIVRIKGQRPPEHKEHNAAEGEIVHLAVVLLELDHLRRFQVGVKGVVLN